MAPCKLTPDLNGNHLASLVDLYWVLRATKNDRNLELKDFFLKTARNGIIAHFRAPTIFNYKAC